MGNGKYLQNLKNFTVLKISEIDGKMCKQKKELPSMENIAGRLGRNFIK